MSSLDCIALAAAHLEASSSVGNPDGGLSPSDATGTITSCAFLHDQNSNVSSASHVENSKRLLHFKILSSRNIVVEEMNSLRFPPVAAPRVVSLTEEECDEMRSKAERLNYAQLDDSFDFNSETWHSPKSKHKAGSAYKSQQPRPSDGGKVLVMENDVLSGRGGESNHHTGNVRYRNLVKAMQLEYLSAKRRDKPLIARKIVEIIRSGNPPGRFLKRNGEGNWEEISVTKAREKTSQALRENAPEIRVAATGDEVVDHDYQPLCSVPDHPMANVKYHTSRAQHSDSHAHLLPSTISSCSNRCLTPVRQMQTQECLSPSSTCRGPRLKLIKTRRMEELHDTAIPSTSTSPTSSSSSLAQFDAFSTVIPSLIETEPPPPAKRSKTAVV